MSHNLRDYGDDMVEILATLVSLAFVGFLGFAIFGVFKKDNRKRYFKIGGYGTFATFVLFALLSPFLPNPDEPSLTNEPQAELSTTSENETENVDGFSKRLALSKERQAKLESLSNVTIKDYKKYRPKKRRKFMKKMAKVYDVKDERKEELFYNCLGNYAFSKSDDLEMRQIFDWCENDRLVEPEEFSTHFNELEAHDFSISAVVYCKIRAKSMLVSPRTAKFKHIRNTRNWGGQEYEFIADVDSQNAFGAMLRSRMRCVIEFDLENEDDFVIKELTFSE